MIIVKLLGGLGNQMFQYAMGRSLADRYNVSLKLDVAAFEHYRLRRYELDDFNIRAEIASENDIASLRVSTKHHTLWHRVKKRLLPSSSKMVFAESSFAYDERFEGVMPPAYLEGYWQTERYFVNDAGAIRNDFTLREPLDAANTAMLEQIQTVNAVSLHVRRGDYVNDRNTSRHHGICSLEYYAAAVGYITDHVENPHIFIFSDDQEWAEENLNFRCHTKFAALNSNNRGVFDMVLMQHCRHHIIANSSFSWWGAWLNPSPHKIVIAPRIWFQKASQDTRDLIPPTWIKL